jgi:hypothetical protein
MDISIVKYKDTGEITDISEQTDCHLKQFQNSDHQHENLQETEHKDTMEIYYPTTKQSPWHINVIIENTDMNLLLQKRWIEWGGVKMTNNPISSTISLDFPAFLPT